MKKAKKFMSAVISASMLLTALPSAGLGVSAKEEDNWWIPYGDELTYRLDDSDGDGVKDSITITSIAKSVTEIEIPEKIEDLPVTTIGSDVCINHSKPGEKSQLRKIKLPDTITDLYGGAFRDAVNLESINIPDGVPYLADAFTNCVSLKSITVPDSVTFMDRAFKGCKNLEKINIPVSVTTIYNQNFYGCEKLRSISLPDSLEYLGGDVFEGTPLISDQKGVKYVGDWVVGSDKNIANVTIKDGTKGICGDAFKECRGLSSIQLPDSLTKICGDAFFYCTSLKKVVLPKNMEKVDRSAFYECIGLETVVLPDGIKEIGYEAFMNCPNLKNINIPESVERIGSGAFINTKLINEAKDAVCVGSWVIGCANEAETIDIKPGVKHIAEGAFAWCSKIESVTIPKSVENILRGAFSSCSSLKNVTIKNPDCLIEGNNEQNSAVKGDKVTICNIVADEFMYGGSGFVPYYYGVIYGYEGSTAQKYAEKCDYEFVSLGEYTGPEPVIGDINGDGKLNVMDAALLCRLLANGQRENIPDNADFNNDGKVDVRDVSAIAYFLVRKA